MLKLTPFLAVILSAATTLVHAGEKQKAFDYNTQIGIAEVTATGDGCLTISNSSLREKQPIKLILLGKPQKVEEKKIRKKLETSCSRNTEISPEASFYSFPAEKEHFDPAIA